MKRPNFRLGGCHWSRIKTKYISHARGFIDIDAQPVSLKKKLLKLPPQKGWLGMVGNSLKETWVKSHRQVPPQSGRAWHRRCIRASHSPVLGSASCPQKQKPHLQKPNASQWMSFYNFFVPNLCFNSLSTTWSSTVLLSVVVLHWRNQRFKPPSTD